MKRKISDSRLIIENFFNAIKNNDQELIINILAIYPALVHATDEYGNNPLSFSISIERIDIAMLLIDHKADVNSINNDITIFQQCLSLNNSINELIVFLLRRSELNILGNYHINPLRIDESPEITARILFQMILKSRRTLEELVDSEILAKIKSSPILLAELENEQLEWEQNEREIFIQTAGTTHQNVTEESIASYAHIRDPIVNLAISQGYIIHATERDGNCFFSSVAASIYGDSSPEVLSSIALRYRSIAIDYMLNHKEEFIGFFEKNEDFYWYLEIMSDPTQEADNPIIKALADVINRPIVIHGAMETVIFPNGDIISTEQYDYTENTRFAAHILYDGRHYDGLRQQNNFEISYVGVNMTVNRLFYLPPLKTIEQIDILEEYALLMESEWFIENVEQLIPEEETIYSINEIGEQDNILCGLMAIYLLLPHKITAI